MANRNKKAAYEIDAKQGVLDVTFETGNKLRFRASDVPEAIVNHLILYAAWKKAQDAFADPDKSPELETSRVWANFRAGVWHAKGGGKASALAEAWSIVKEVSIDDAMAKMSTLSDDVKKEVKAHPEIKAEMTRIEAERAAAKAKAAALVAVDDLPEDVIDLDSL